MKVLILSVPRNLTPHLENISWSQILRMTRALESNGYVVQKRTYTPETVERDICAFEPDIIFNVAYGFRSNDGEICEYQHETSRRIEGIYHHVVGSTHLTQEIAQDKRKTAAVVRDIVRAPHELSFTELHQAGIGVAKPRFGACHRGIRFVKSRIEFELLQAAHVEEYLLQEYVEGTEYTVSVLECGTTIHVLTPFEIRFTPEFMSRPRLMDWDFYRWEFVPDANAPQSLAQAARNVFRALGMRDYARFDFRLCTDGPVLLDANALPNLSPFGSILPRMAAFDGIDYDELILRLIRNATERLLDEPTGKLTPTEDS